MENHFKEDFYIPENKLTRGQKLVRYYFKKVGPLFPNSTKRLFWRLFTTPRKRKPTSSQQEFIKKATTRSITLKQRNTTYCVHDFGDGPKTVLIFHGWEGMTSDFKNLIESLVLQQFRVISIDFPGHGTAPKSRAHLPLFIDVIKDYITYHSTEIKFDAIIGHSLGAAALALAVPDIDNHRFDRLAFLGLHPKPSDFILQYKSITQINQSLFEKCIQFAEKKVNTELLHYDCTLYLKNYNQYPILLVHDEKDSVIHVSRIQEFAGKVQSSQLFVGNNGGHFRHYKHPDVIRAISAFIVG